MCCVANQTDWQSAQTLFLPLISQLDPRPRFLPMAVPEDLAPRLSVIHGDPGVWWLGQLIRYLIRPNPKLLDHKVAMMKKLEFKKPIVGYPTYMFVSDNNVSMLASAKSRYSNTSLLGIIMDISFLSMSDFLVCTFSSNVCRAAYELMQANEGDASSYAVSLDKRFYFNGQRDERMWTVEKHKAENRHQLSFESGDLLQIIGNDLSGMVSRALNLRTGKEGVFPTYKAVKEIVAVKMPTYPEVGEPNEA
nr:hypothetical protein BaRGS_017788 [Batillaria attramentaria]